MTRRVVAAALLTGCMKWTAAAPTPEGLGRARDARVTLTTGQTVVLSHPTVERDSVIGRAQASSARVAYALRDVSAIRVARPDPAPILMAVIVAIAGAVVVTCAVDEQGCMGS